ALPPGGLLASAPRPRRARPVRAAPAGRNRPRPRRVRLVLRERGRVYGDREASPPPIVRRRRTEAPPIDVGPLHGARGLRHRGAGDVLRFDERARPRAGRWPRLPRRNAAEGP